MYMVRVRTTVVYIYVLPEKYITGQRRSTIKSYLWEIRQRMKLAGLLLVLAVLPTYEATRISPRQTPSIVYQQFVIDSVIVARYSNTRISSVVRNNADISQELSFRVQLPETAFISNFTMWVISRSGKDLGRGGGGGGGGGSVPFGIMLHEHWLSLRNYM